MAVRSTGATLGFLVVTAICATAVAQPRQMTMKVPEGRGMVMSKYGYDETVSRIKQAIENEQMMVLFTADHQQMLKLVGVDTGGGMATIEFFHPRYGKRIFEGNRDAAAEIPLRIMVMESPMGAMVSWVKPSRTIGRYKGLAPLGSELDAVVQKIAESVTR
jgi:uncharacterized protein (DUF302 family)